MFYRRDKKVFIEVFDHMMTMIVEISNSPVARKQGEHVFAVFKYMFNEMKDNVVSLIREICHFPRKKRLKGIL